MAEETNVAEEIQQEEIVQPQTESQPQQEAQPNSDKEYNFRQLEKSKKEMEESYKHLRGEHEELKKYIQNIASQNQQAPQEDDLGLGDEDLAEGKHLKKVRSELRAMKEEMAKQYAQAIPDRLQSRFSDFNEVVSKENVEKLKNTEPELYSSITSGSDLYAKGVSAYKALKALGYVQPTYSAEKQQVNSNHARPMSAQSIKGQGALSEKNIFAGGLTPQLKTQLQKEMAEAAKAR